MADQLHDPAAGEEPFPQGRRCYVGNLAWRTSWQDLKDHFKPCGNVVYANVMQDGQGRSRGWGIVEFETSDEAAVACQEKNGSELDNREIMVREDREDRDIKRTRKPVSRPAREDEPSGLQVVVHGIPWSFDDEQLGALFTGYEPAFGIEVAEIVYGKDGRSRGYGTVRFRSESDVQRAIQEFNGYELDGRNLTVKIDQYA